MAISISSTNKIANTNLCRQSNGYSNGYSAGGGGYGGGGYGGGGGGGGDRMAALGAGLKEQSWGMFVFFFFAFSPLVGRHRSHIFLQT